MGQGRGWRSGAAKPSGTRAGRWRQDFRCFVCVCGNTLLSRQTLSFMYFTVLSFFLPAPYHTFKESTNENNAGKKRRLF